ncbi:Gfo/Idh/MocA family protein [Gynurincola endophyticus]|uniref:Gfo/Idh/MocA family protein n=1 Tax=Gynurincola endophyticus TaxID=2479004 RepID=UPI000F8D1EE0|nr:Gfo/Idh/MocA family oxidoreductase [Gynurincola endophyticus]
MRRRTLLKNLGLGLGGTILTNEAIAAITTDVQQYTLPDNPFHIVLEKPVTAITLGAGGRGTVYGNYALQFPQNMKIVGVAEPVAFRNQKYTTSHNIPHDNRFNTWEDVFKRPKFADAIIISTPDNLHYGPCMQALEMGYDILLEKPIAPTEKECRAILKKAQQKGRIVAVCHVLRYAPYFVKMREMIAEGAVGEVISVQHLEPIEFQHMAHSYVRGNWHNSKQTTPIILAKSCHDLDIIKWVINKRCTEISAMGDLKWFRKENAPEGSTDRCINGCKVEKTCPYSALKIYTPKSTSRNRVLDLSEDKTKHEAEIKQRMYTTNYGRCVYRMENDQPDHYISNIQFEDNITASFSMEAFTSYAGRRTRVMGSMGDMVGDMKELVVTDFITGKVTRLQPKYTDVAGYEKSGHGGGDWLMMRDFVQAVAQQNASLLTSTIEESIESHIMGFKAEESRLQKKFRKVVV